MSISPETKLPGRQGSGTLPRTGEQEGERRPAKPPPPWAAGPLVRGEHLISGGSLHRMLHDTFHPKGNKNQTEKDGRHAPTAWTLRCARWRFLNPGGRFPPFLCQSQRHGENRTLRTGLQVTRGRHGLEPRLGDSQSSSQQNPTGLSWVHGPSERTVGRRDYPRGSAGGSRQPAGHTPPRRSRFTSAFPPPRPWLGARMRCGVHHTIHAPRRTTDQGEGRDLGAGAASPLWSPSWRWAVL